ncbi:MAG: shikimate dehydrogenase, partial [Dehalococcoidia bacterium]|nr:shikimate dehydrogenase [Dehalococcoidia bacterium]
VNATSVGMSPDTEQTLVPAEFLRAGLVVFDIIYNPPRTRLLREAEEKGAQIINGLEMLVWQGVSAFKLWTGVKPPVAVMREAAIKALNLNEK